MAKIKEKSTSGSSGNMRPAFSPEARENQLISLAYDLVEKRLRDGSATSQETTYFLKQSARETQLKNELLETQKELAIAKAESLRREAHTERLFKDAIAAMKRYSGHGSDEDEEDEG